MPDDQRSEQGAIGELPPRPLLYDTEPDVVLHPAKLELLLRDYEEGRRSPRFRDALPWVATGIALLAGLVTGEPRDVLKVPGEIWQLVLILGAIVSWGGGVVQVVRALDKVRGKPITARELVAKVIAEMTRGE